MQEKPNINFTDRFILYMDILGSEQIIYHDPSKKEIVLDIIKFFNSINSNYGINILSREPTGTSYQLIPSISSFSDHIVISYPTSTISDDKDVILDQFLFLDGLIQIAVMIYKYTLLRGILMRGAIAVGEFIHEGGIVTGKALNEVVKLEEHTAIYPRVIASNSIVKLSSKHSTISLLRDFDGLYYIDYLKDFRIYGREGIQSLIIFLQQINTHIQNNLAKFYDNLHILAKWQWLAYKFDESLGYWHSRSLNIRDALNKIPKFNLTSLYLGENYPRIAPWLPIEEKYNIPKERIK